MSNTKYAAMEAEAIKDGRIDRAALVELVRQAMSSGVACAVDRMSKGEVGRDADWAEIFGDFPEEWIDIRAYLVDALLVVPGV